MALSGRGGAVLGRAVALLWAGSSLLRAVAAPPGAVAFLTGSAGALTPSSRATAQLLLADWAVPLDDESCGVPTWPGPFSPWTSVSPPWAEPPLADGAEASVILSTTGTLAWLPLGLAVPVVAAASCPGARRSSSRAATQPALTDRAVVGTPLLALSPGAVTKCSRAAAQPALAHRAVGFSRGALRASAVPSGSCVSEGASVSLPDRHQPDWTDAAGPSSHRTPAGATLREDSAWAATYTAEGSGWAQRAPAQ